MTTSTSPSGDSKIQTRVLTAATELVRSAGFNVEITEIATRANVSTSSLYRHFEGRDAVIEAILCRMRARFADRMIQIARIDNGYDAGVAWMNLGFSVLEEIGELGLAVCEGRVPERFRALVVTDDLRRFTGMLLKRSVDQGFLRGDFDVRSAVRVWFALAASHRVLGCLEDGLSYDEIGLETLEIFMRIYGK